MTCKPRGAGRVLPSQCQSRRLVQPRRNLFAITSMSWWSQTESNRRHPACKAGALPTELWPRSSEQCGPGELSATCRLVDPAPGLPEVLVGPGRLELPTLRLSGVRSNHLSYGPMAATAGEDPQARDRMPVINDRMSRLTNMKVERETETAASRIVPLTLSRFG